MIQELKRIDNYLNEQPGKKWMPAPSLKHLWIALPIFVIVLKGFLFPLPLLDFWWHLKMGQVIFETRSIPTNDIFSFTAAGQPFAVQNWFAEILLYLGYKAGGDALLVFANTTLLVVTLLPVYHLCLKAARRQWPGVLAATLVATCITCNLRPQVISFVLFAVYYWLLSCYCSGKRDWIWLLPILTVLWVNMHGAFLLGIGLIAIFLGCQFVGYLPGPDRITLKERQLRKLALILAFCLLASLANPNGFGVYSYVRTVMSDPSSQQLVMEWQPPSIATVQGIAQFYLPFFLMTSVLVMAQQRPNLTELVLYLGFSAFAMTATRNSPWFLLITAPILARYLPSVNWAAVSLRWSKTKGKKQYPSNPAQKELRGKQQYPLLNLAIAIMAITIVVMQSPWLQQRLHSGSLIDPMTPIGAMDYMESHQLKGNTFHPQIYGDYLIWKLWPVQRSFFDGRVHLFGEPFVRLYRKIYDDVHWEDLLKPYDIRYLLLSKLENKPEGKRMIDSVRGSDNWKILYEDRSSILFEKQNQAPQGLDPRL